MKKDYTVLYYIGVLLAFFSTITGWSSIINLGAIYYVLAIISITLLGIYFLSYRHSFKQLFIIFLIFVIFLYTFIKTGNFLFLLNFMLIISSKNINFNKVVKIDAIVKLSLFVIHFFVYIFNLLFNLSLMDNIHISNTMGIRKSLLFTGPNALSALVFWLIMDYLILNRNKKDIIKKSIFMLVPIILCFLFTKTRTTLFLYMLYLILVLLIKYSFCKRLINFMHLYISDFLFLCSTLILVYSQYIINHFNSIFVIFNKLLSSRLIFSINAYNEYGFNILANLDAISNPSKYIIDNFYILTITSYGIIIYILISLLNKYIGKQINCYFKIIIIIAFLYLFFESLSFNGGLCIFILLLGYLFCIKGAES